MTCLLVRRFSRADLNRFKGEFSQIYVANWHFLDLASMAAIRIKPDIRNFVQMAGLSAQQALVQGAAKVGFPPFVTDAAFIMNVLVGLKGPVSNTDG